MERTYEPKTLIHNLLDKQRLSQRRFSDYMGVDAPTVSTWCSGKRMPSDPFIDKMAEVLQVDRDYLRGYLVALSVVRNQTPVVASHVADHIKKELESRFLDNLNKEL
jgi:transcriptional regulator with XRE-family HTH domain